MTNKVVAPKGWKPIGIIDRKGKTARAKDIKEGTVVGIIVMTPNYDTEILLEPSFANGDPMTRASVLEVAQYVISDEFASSIEKLGEETFEQNKNKKVEDDE